jgi:Protein of unknown function (DUF1353)
MFRTDLRVAHLESGTWKLTQPLIFEGKEQYFIIKSDFRTDFASIPKPVRVLLDNAGANSEAAVLHDAVWRESQREDNPRVDPWDADGLFRRGLRETGATALSRGFMWAAVRLAAIRAGRWGSPPSRALMVVQLVGLLLIGLPVVGPPVLAAIAGMIAYWIVSWIFAVIWWPFERLRLKAPTNWPWAPGTDRPVHDDPPSKEMLVIVAKPKDAKGASQPHPQLEELLKDHPNPTDADVEKVFPESVP